MKTLDKIVNGLLIGIAACATFLLAAVHVMFIVLIAIMRAAWRA